MNTEQLDAIQARHRLAESLKVKPNGDSHTREYVRGLESVATDVPALLAYARDLEARIGREVDAAVEAGLATHDWEMFEAQQGDIAEAVAEAIRAALTATEAA